MKKIIRSYHRYLWLFLLLIFGVSYHTVTAQITGNNQDVMTVTGIVTNENGIPIPGASVLVENTKQGTVTDFDGNYSIDAATGASLQFSYVGYVTQNITVTNRTVNVQLVPDTQSLEEVVVIGYGTVSKKDLVSSVSSVDGEVLQNQPVVRLDQALQGRATGVEVTSNNGAPGTGSTIRIRGNSSIQGNNNPLYVVDGFIAGTGFNLSNLNVNDIESVEILKDATALAIYGTRGASGVILITTKNGKGAPKGSHNISVNHYTSMQNTVNEINLLKGQEYVDYINEAGRFVPGDPVEVNGVMVPLGATDPELPLVIEPGEFANTDWLDLISQTGIIRNTDLSFTGNGEYANYYVSVNHFDQEGLIKGSGIERLSLRTNLDAKLNKTIRSGVRLNLTRFKRENNKVNYGQIIRFVLPVRSVFDEDGEYTATDPATGTTERNPVADIELREDHNIITNLIANTYLEIEPIENLVFRSTFGAQLNFNKDNSYISAFAPERLQGNQNGGQATVIQGQTLNWLNENTVSYSPEFDKHDLNILAGFTWQKNTAETSSATAQGFPNDQLQFNNLGFGSDPETYEVGSGYAQRTLVSYLSRITYGFDDRYILTMVGRIDGSSVFETGNKYSFFPSVGVAWNMHNEKFLENSNTINNLKLRTSYGIIGEQGVGAYNSFDLLNDQNTYFNENLVPAVVLGRIASDGLEWETTKQLDMGLEVSFFNNRIQFEVDYYKRTTEDLLLNFELPDVAGGTQLRNVGSIENRGFEFGLNTLNVSTENFSWETSLSLTTNNSEVLDIGDLPFINLQSTGAQAGPSARLIEGEAIPSFVGARYLGVYTSAEQIIADDQVGRVFLGSPRFEDLDGNGVINQEDYVILGSPQPDFFGGIRNVFKYKNVSLELFFHGQYGNDIFNVRSQTSLFGRTGENLDPAVVNRYIPGVNENTTIPRAGTSLGNFNPNSSLNIEDGSFLRLRTVTLGVDIPVKNTSMERFIKGANVYVSGNNLLLFSDFRLGDPEVNSFTAGSGAGSISQGFAGGQYPYGRTITAGFRIDF